MTAVAPVRPYEGVGRKISLLRQFHQVFTENGLPDGVAYFGALREVDPVLADKLRGTTVDPFYHEDRIQFFLTYVYTNWGQRNVRYE